jgi:hypothetical protein
MIKFIFHWWWKNSFLSFILYLSKTNNFYNKKILLCYHAKELLEWEESFNKDLLCFEKNLIKSDLIYKWNLNFLELKEQIKASDIIIFKWWNTKLVKERLFGLKNDIQILKNKTVIWISAWAYVFSNNYYSNDRKKIEKWLNIVDINLICHYSRELNNIKLLMENKLWKTYTIKENNILEFCK